MLALGIRYLTKYAAATNAARQQAEWPPHPGRVFMALAAAHFEGGGDSGEREALEWLEAQSPPGMRASGADERSLVRAYVPVNDIKGEAALAGRPRQDRVFPRTRPHEDTAYLIWEAEPRAAVRSGLEQVCRKVTRIGHSSSAVQMWVVEPGGEPEPNWRPGEGMEAMRMRVAARGTLEYLESAFNGAALEEYDGLAEALAGAKGKQKRQLSGELAAKFPGGRPVTRRPQLVAWQGYERARAVETGADAAEGPFDEAFVVLAKTEGPVLGLESTLQLTGALRNAAMKAAGDGPPEWLTGHREDGSPSAHAHAAFFPLPYVGYEHADGHVMGLGLAIPRRLPDGRGRRDEELRRCLGPLLFDPETGEPRTIRIWKERGNGGGRVWEWMLERETRERPPLSLRRETWTRPSRHWASVTPVVLHHHPKRRQGDVERIVREAFVSALLPEPEEVRTASVAAVAGVGHALGMPGFTEGGANLCRYQTHVEVWFSRPVRGPVLVGRGRFRGYGLFRPLGE
jgi:CRISPR-associated protein Csb2